jgi:hypothetical protein
MTYDVDAPAKDVADYYADRLAAVGWSEPYLGLVQRIPGDPLRYSVWVDYADPAAHPEWEDVHFIVEVTVLSPERSEVGLAVRRYVNSVF